jgi:serine/threonine protein kinase
MSPEQLRDKPIDARTDIFSLGITLYHLLEGKLPFEGATMTESATKILRDPPPPSQQAEQLRLPGLAGHLRQGREAYFRIAY